MKKKIKPWFQILLIVFILIGKSTYSSGQEKLNLSLGFGFPEMINTGIKYQYEPIQFGLGVGWLKGSFEMVTVSGDIYIHFAGTSAFNERKPWFGRTGLTYLRYEDEWWVQKFTLLNTRFGREFNFSERVGIAIDAGVIYKLCRESMRKPSDGFDDQEGLYLPKVFPSLGFNLFFRL